jgi:hypothetical protein
MADAEAKAKEATNKTLMNLNILMRELNAAMDLFLLFIRRYIVGLPDGMETLNNWTIWIFLSRAFTVKVR